MLQDKLKKNVARITGPLSKIYGIVKSHGQLVQYGAI